jgi:hypothetical protein
VSAHFAAGYWGLAYTVLVGTPWLAALVAAIRADMP